MFSPSAATGGTSAFMANLTGGLATTTSSTTVNRLDAGPLPLSRLWVFRRDPAARVAPAAAVGLHLTADNDCRIQSVTPGTLAAAVGLTPGAWFVLSVNSTRVSNDEEFYREVSKSLDTRVLLFEAEPVNELIMELFQPQQATTPAAAAVPPSATSGKGASDDDDDEFAPDFGDADDNAPAAKPRAEAATPLVPGTAAYYESKLERNPQRYGFLTFQHPLYAVWERLLLAARNQRDALFEAERLAAEVEARRAAEAKERLKQQAMHLLGSSSDDDDTSSSGSNGTSDGSESGSGSDSDDETDSGSDSGLPSRSQTRDSAAALPSSGVVATAPTVTATSAPLGPSPYPMWTSATPEPPASAPPALQRAVIGAFMLQHGEYVAPTQRQQQQQAPQQQQQQQQQRRRMSMSRSPSRRDRSRDGDGRRRRRSPTPERRDRSRVERRSDRGSDDDRLSRRRDDRKERDADRKDRRDDDHKSRRDDDRKERREDGRKERRDGERKERRGDERKERHVDDRKERRDDGRREDGRKERRHGDRTHKRRSRSPARRSVSPPRLDAARDDARSERPMNGDGGKRPRDGKPSDVALMVAATDASQEDKAVRLAMPRRHSSDDAAADGASRKDGKSAEGRGDRDRRSDRDRARRGGDGDERRDRSDQKKERDRSERDRGERERARRDDGSRRRHRSSSR